MKKDKWWQHVLWAVFCFALAAWLYYDLTKFEEVGGSRRMNAIVALLYNILGKWGAVGFFVLLGGFFSVLGVKGLAAGKQEPPAPPAAS
jgi:hypothetical protein